MIAYLVTVKEPKKQAGKFHITRGVVVAKDSVHAEKLVKEEYYTNGARGWHPEASFNFVLLDFGFFPV